MRDSGTFFFDMGFNSSFELIEKPYISVRGGRIISAGQWIGNKPRILPNKQETYFPQSLVCPAFVNAHTHLSYTLFRKSLWETHGFEQLSLLSKVKKQLRPDFLRSSIAAGRLESLKYGIGTIADSVHLDLADAVELQTKKNLPDIIPLFTLRSDTDIKGVINHLSKSPFRTGVLPHSLYAVSPQKIEEWLIYAKKSSLIFSMHLSEFVEEDEFFRSNNVEGKIGQKLKLLYPSPSPKSSAIQKAAELGALFPRSLLVHCTFADADDLKVIAKAQAYVCLCPRSASQLSGKVLAASELIKEGVRFCVATDSAATCGNYDILADLGLLYEKDPNNHLLQLGELIKSITLNPANVLGASDDVGSLDVGKSADFVVFELNEAPNLKQVKESPWKFINSKNIRSTYLRGVEAYNRSNQVGINDHEKKSSEEIKNILRNL